MLCISHNHTELSPRPVPSCKQYRELFLWTCMRKQPTFHEVATWALAKRRLSNESRNSILMTCTTQILVVLLIGWKKIPTNQKHYQDLGRDWRHQYWISALVTSFCEGSSGDLVKRQLFFQATLGLFSAINSFMYASRKSFHRLVTETLSPSEFCASFQSHK